MKDFTQLRASVDAAREEYNQALEAQREVFQRYSGSPHPDGSQHVHHVNAALRVALEQYTQALRDLTDHVVKRTQGASGANRPNVPSTHVTMQVYKVNFVLAAENTTHTTYIHAANAKEALQKLADRFPGEPREIHAESITEDHGKFVIGAEEQDFSQ
jgi:hypothetical protein